jgi:intergrase/recombinase
LNDPSKINTLPVSIKSNVLKALIALSKYLGIYTEFSTAFKNHGIKWSTGNSFNAFLNIVNNNHSGLIEWYHKATEVLGNNEKLYLKYCLLSGLRAHECLNSFNLVISLRSNDHLNDYYDRELSILQHFKYPMFLRNSKNAFITAIDSKLLDLISNSEPVSYAKIRKRLSKNNLPLRIKELRSYYATYLRNHGIISEYIDLFQGRVSKDVFSRNYLKVENLKELANQILNIVKDLETSTA